MAKNNMSTTQKWRIEISTEMAALKTQIGNHLSEHRILSGRLFTLLLIILSGIIGIFVRLAVQ